MTVVWIGLKEFEEKLVKSIAEVPAVMHEELRAVADQVLQEAQAHVEANLKHPDIDTGEVAASGHVDSRGEEVAVVFDYDGALAIHEGASGNESHRHFLSGPTLASEPEVIQAGAEAVRKAF